MNKMLLLGNSSPLWKKGTLFKRTYASFKPVRLTNRPARATDDRLTNLGTATPGNSSISKSSQSKNPKSFRIWQKILLGLTGSTVVIYLGDTYLGHGIIKRNVKSIFSLLKLSIDYKLNFNENYDIDELHERNAQRLYDLIIDNKGLYIKLGQMIAVQGVMFPKHYQDKFKLLFDKAPVESWETCDLTLKKELGENYETELFEQIEKIPIASASIAQVHKAVLKNGKEVAVKIQKNSVSRQVESDLFTYRMVMKFYAWIFDMPLEHTINYVCEKMRTELNFKTEYENAVMVTELINSDNEFKNSMEYYIPKYYGEISTKKILISEWMNAELIGKYEGLQDLGFSLSKLMLQITKFYARQVFTWGVVHCDLHPGNLMVRNIDVENNGFTRIFSKSKTIQQLIILDHGLYEHFTPTFKRQYSEFWKYSMEKNYEKTKNILSAWGLDADEIIMTMAGLGDKNSPAMQAHISKMKEMSYFERQVMLREKFKDFFANTDKFPLCLVFVLRSMRIVQGLNRNFGAPVNRLAILVDEANKSVDQLLRTSTEVDTWNDYLTRKYVSWTIKLITDSMFQANRLYAWVHSIISSAPVKTLEDSYDDDVVQSGKLFGLESVPSSKELIV